MRSRRQSPSCLIAYLPTVFQLKRSWRDQAACLSVCSPAAGPKVSSRGGGHCCRRCHSLQKELTGAYVVKSRCERPKRGLLAKQYVSEDTNSSCSPFPQYIKQRERVGATTANLCDQAPVAPSLIFGYQLNGFVAQYL